MYSFESRIRYSEVDQNQELSVTGIINYLAGLLYLSVRRPESWHYISPGASPRMVAVFLADCDREVSKTGRGDCCQYLAL